MKVHCPNCGRLVGEYTGPIGDGHVIASANFKYPNGRSPRRGSSSVYACLCKHRFDIVSELKRMHRAEVRDAL